MKPPVPPAFSPEEDMMIKEWVKIYGTERDEFIKNKREWLNRPA